MDVWESTLMKIMNDVESPAQGIGKADVPCIRVTATPGMTFSGNSLILYSWILIDIGKHIAGVIGAINDAILHAIPPVGHFRNTSISIR